MGKAVVILIDAQRDLDALPVKMYRRVLEVLKRLADWPDVSGAKPLRHQWKGHYRIRTGDWRVIFTVIEPDIIVVRIKHRSEVYED